MRNAALGCGAAVVCLLLLVLGLGRLGSKAWAFERAVLVKAQPAEFHPLIGDLRRWPEWSFWLRDANAENDNNDLSKGYVLQGEPGAGQSLSWRTARGNACTLTLLRADPATGVDYELAIADFPSTARGTLAYAPAEGGTKVTWSTSGERTDRLGGLFARLMEPLLGQKYAEDLERLRARFEPAQ